MARIQFTSVLIDGHKGAAVEVPFDPVKKWNVAAMPLRPGRRGHVVEAEINGQKFTTAIVPRSNKFWLLVEEPVIKKTKIAVGDTVRIAIINSPVEE